MIEPLSEADQERLEELRAAAMLLRFPVLAAGGLLGLYGLFGVINTVTILGALVWLLGSESSGLLFLSSFVGNAMLTGLDLAGAGLLIHSGLLGMAARADPGRLPGAMRSLRNFWYVLLFRVVASVGSTAVQVLLMWMA